MRNSLVLLTLLLALTAQAQEVSSPKTMTTSPLTPAKRIRSGGLFFPAEKNNLQVLPQRFEYSLDDQFFKVGDVSLEINQLTFRLEKNDDPQNPYKARFTWPAGLINQGELAIKNNSGIAIFKTTVSPQNLTLTEIAGNKPTEEDAAAARSQLATYTADLSKELIEDMRYLPFMTFCIYNEQEKTKLYLCSQELFLAHQKKAPQIELRKVTEKPTHVSINGKVVGNQGYIYLNSAREDVVFLAQAPSGAFLDIQTRRQDVDFKDVVLSAEPNRILITASGADPVDESKALRLPNGDWQMSISKSRPFLYLKGAGGIPMRQEFAVRGELPRAKNRPVIATGTTSQTYGHRVEISGQTPPGVSVSLQENDKESTLASKQNRFKWNLNRLPANIKDRRYLTLLSEDGTSTVAYDIFRGLPFNAAVGATYHTPASMASADLKVEWWIEDLFNLGYTTTRFRWGLGLERNQNLLENSDYAKMDITTFELLWRAHPGLNFVDSSWGLIFPVQILQIDANSITTYGLGGYWMKKTDNPFFRPLMSWSKLKFNYFLGSSGDQVKISSAWSAEALAFYPLQETLFVKYGIGLNQYQFDPAPTKQDIQLHLTGGAVFVF